MERHGADRGDGPPPSPQADAGVDICEWASRELRVAVTPHDRRQVSFLATLHEAGTEELRVIVSTYDGLDTIAGTHRQAELSWKAAAARAALAQRTGGRAADRPVQVQPAPSRR